MKLNNTKIAVIGGDCRMLYAANAFSKAGAECAVFANDASITDSIAYTKARTLSDALGEASAVLLPIPLSRDKYTLNAPFYNEKLSLEKIALSIPENACVCAGLPMDAFEGFPFSVMDYGSDRYFAIKNAEYTAEGAISIAIDKSNLALDGSKCCIFGYGRIGKALSKRLLSFGASISVFARDPKDRELIEHNGLRHVSYSLYEEELKDCDFLFNTVPDRQIASLYRSCPSSTLIIELAGQHCSEGNIINASSLPSIYSPKSAGILIFKTVCRNLGYCEKGE